MLQLNTSGDSSEPSYHTGTGPGTGAGARTGTGHGTRSRKSSRTEQMAATAVATVPAMPATWDRILLMPELAYAIQCFLDRHHLAVASCASQTWHQIWTPFLWKHLSLPRPRPLPPVASRPPTASSTTTTIIDTTGTTALSQLRHSRSTSTMDSNDHEEFAYALSSSCLDLLGHYVMRLDATWLTTPELLRITTYCLHLHALKLADCPLPTRVLSTLLKSLTQLSRLSLDIPLQDYSVDEEEDGGAACEQGAVAAEGDEASRGRIYHKDELGENEIMKAIETSAHPDSLDYLELTFQSSVRISVNAVCSLLRHQHGMRTLKLVDADIEELQPRRTKNKKKNKGDRRKKGNRGNHNSCNINNNGETSSTAASASATETSAALSDTSSSTTSGLSLRSTSPSNSDTDDSSSSSGDTGSPPPEREDVESFGLLFLSISSSHTSDSSLIRILERCPQLRALHLHSCDAITNQALKAVVQHCPQLESISLSSCKQLSTAGLDRFFREAVSPLVHVHLCDQAAVRDETLEILARQHGRSLLKLAVYFCALITEKGVKALLAACSQLRVFGLQAYGMTPAIFEQPWASRQTLEQLDLQGVFKAVTDPSVATTDFSVTAQWQDRQARIDGFALTKTRLMTLVRLKNLRLAAGGIGKEVLGGFGPSQRIEVLHLYGLQSTQVDSLPWSAIKTAYPYLRQVYCNVIGVMGKSLREELDRLNVELLASSSIPDLAFENNFDD